MQEHYKWWHRWHKYRLTKLITKISTDSHDTMETIIKSVLERNYKMTNAKNNIHLVNNNDNTSNRVRMVVDKGTRTTQNKEGYGVEVVSGSLAAVAVYIYTSMRC